MSAAEIARELDAALARFKRDGSIGSLHQLNTALGRYTEWLADRPEPRKMSELSPTIIFKPKEHAT